MMVQRLLPQSPIKRTSKKRSSSSASSSDEGAPAAKQAHAEEEGEGAELRLLRLLLQCAEWVAVDNLGEALRVLPEISWLSSPLGSSPERVAAYFSEALRARIVSSLLCCYSPLPAKAVAQRIPRCFHLLNSLTPLIKFSHFTSNQAIFESLRPLSRVHILDLDIMQGLQWPGLFHILASRPRPLRSVRITGVGPDASVLEATGRRLADFAASLGLPFRFTPFEGKVADLAPPFLRADGDDEPTVVHWTQHCLYDVTGSDLAASRLLSSLRPRLVTVVEQDLGHGAGFLGRFVEALHYYSALFDAIGDAAPSPDDRWEVEQAVLAGEIRNIVAVGGPKRTGEVRVQSWAHELPRAGFRPVSLAGSPAAQAALLLGMVPWKGYTLVQDAGRLKLGWKDLSLLTASAWTPLDAPPDDCEADS